VLIVFVFYCYAQIKLFSLCIIIFETGGWPHDVMEYVQNNTGIATASSYSYVSGKKYTVIRKKFKKFIFFERK